MTHSAELRQRLQAGIQELDSDIAKLRDAIAALDTASATTSRPARRRSRRAAAPEYEVVPAAKLASLLSASDAGLSTTDLARQAQGDPKQVLTLLKELEQDGRAHRSGARRSTRWHAGAASESPDTALATEAGAARHPEPGQPDALGEAKSE